MKQHLYGQEYEVIQYGSKWSWKLYRHGKRHDGKMHDSRYKADKAAREWICRQPSAPKEEK